MAPPPADLRWTLVGLSFAAGSCLAKMALATDHGGPEVDVVWFILCGGLLCGEAPEVEVVWLLLCVPTSLWQRRFGGRPDSLEVDVVWFIFIFLGVFLVDKKCALSRWTRSRGLCGGGVSGRSSGPKRLQLEVPLLVANLLLLDFELVCCLLKG